MQGPQLVVKFQAVESLTRAQIADEFGDLDAAVQRFKPTAERHKKLREVINQWHAGLDAEETIVHEGARWEIQVGARSNERSWVSMAKLYKAFGGLKAFLAACQVTIKAAIEVIGQNKVDELLVEERTGCRRLKAVPRATAVEAVEKAA